MTDTSQDKIVALAGAKRCPFCGSSQLKEDGGGFLEVGEWDGHRYAEELNVTQYVCQGSLCGRRFWTE